MLFIIVFSTIGKQKAVDILKTGANVMKDNLARLGPAVELELRKVESRRQRREKGGTHLPVEITGNFCAIGDKRFFPAIAHNLTGHKQAEKEKHVPEA